MSTQSLGSQEIITLLSKLKDTTPDYPIDLLAARKAAFLQAAVAVQIHGKGMSGKGGGDGGSLGHSGSGLFGGMSAAQSILLQAVIGVWIIAAMLTAAYVFKDQILDLLQDNGIVPVELTFAPASESTVPVTVAPATEIPPTALTPLAGTPIPGVLPENEIVPDAQNTPDPGNDNPGLHLGQTPGSPDNPNQDNQGKPDKPAKPDKPK